ncbi:folylpolyglutamate synthase-like isoform X1 [Tripterygium wilfordii]|uniref:tetrahydrofolate synthase n=1 Tax=Tripterygium wilfordii TaxID=458696 RepID=A0A7J7CUA3_TRIWF|nr:folylpolyglutamate synthase [Tripterygium wilfordii]XP_038721463.1 folylpolyglutamate synthase [Tripterygium wilfordii]XP_038721464.1 folylpolyglutamate synthase [Tripterygium wilfordii]KAF5737677.1 folylpolyglutamate synthase-like isoform X1 [Tripterygium wilfordii]
MHVSTSIHPKCEVFGVSHFHGTERGLSIRTRWSLSCKPACIDSHSLVLRCKLHYQESGRIKGLRYPNMSFRITERGPINVAVNDDLPDLPLSISYDTAMEALSSLITQQKRGDKSPVVDKFRKMERMSRYLKILGLEERIAGLKIIHVAGTKGKGSTCTFCEAILRACGLQTGLFTSPHLIDVTERFRINGSDISEDKFLQYFWDCWNQLKENVSEDLPMPPLFQFLTILAFKVFVCEQVDVAIIEVGLGGKEDSTNVINEPVVCGITSLGMDHMETLGHTLAEIAAHKAGIFKPHVPAFTVPQVPEAMDVLQQTAYGLAVPLKVVAPLDSKQLQGVKLSLSGDHQLINAGLAASLCRCWLQKTGNWEKLFHNEERAADLPKAFLIGLSTAHLAGRAQIVYDCSSKSSDVTGDLIFYLDGAHSPESMEACAKWFSGAVTVDKQLSKSTSTSSSSAYHESILEGGRNGSIEHLKENADKSNMISKKILLFNCMELRDPEVLLPQILSTCASSGTHFSKAIFTPSTSKYTKVTSGTSVLPSEILNKDLSWQFSLQRLWEKIIHGKETNIALDNTSKMIKAGTLPSHEFLYKDASHCCPANKDFTCSAVIPSLPLTIKWLRDCVKENPSLRLQVLVTGSLHLVGDVLKLLRRRP